MTQSEAVRAYRKFRNETTAPLTLKLHLRKENYIDKIRGSQNLFLPPGESKLIDIGDFRNANLNGIELSYRMDGDIISYCVFVANKNSKMDMLLNLNENLVIKSIDPIVICKDQF